MNDQHFTCEAPKFGRLDAVLTAAIPEDLSRARVTALIKSGVATVDGTVVKRPSVKVRAGQILAITIPAPAQDHAQPQDIPLDIVYQDADVVVVNKPAGMVVHPAPGHPDGTLVNALLHHITDLSGVGGVQRPGIVHRLDKGTSGLLVVAKNDQAHRALQAQFADRTAGRTYLALVRGAPVLPSGTIQSIIARHPTQRHKYASTTRDGKPAITHWKVVARAGRLTLVKCKLETGRTHQIRVHLTEKGWPLVGDPLYRRRGAGLPATARELVDPAANRPFLHAWKLQFVHPSTEQPMSFAAPLPSDFTALLDALEIQIPRDARTPSV